MDEQNEPGIDSDLTDPDDLAEPAEDELEDKPPVPNVEEDINVPDEEEVPEEDFQTDEEADEHPETDNREDDIDND